MKIYLIKQQQEKTKSSSVEYIIKIKVKRCLPYSNSFAMWKYIVVLLLTSHKERKFHAGYSLIAKALVICNVSIFNKNVKIVHVCMCISTIMVTLISPNSFYEIPPFFFKASRRFFRTTRAARA